MPYLFLNFLLVLTLFTGLLERFNRISSTNRVKESAEKYFNNKDYNNAALCYDSLISYFNIDDEKIHLNLAHSYFKNNDKKRAAVHYQQLSKSSDIEIASAAEQQLGLIAAMKGKTDEAINFYKRALIINPENEIARYNLELVKKLKEMEMEGSSKASSSKGTGKNKGGSQKGNQSKEGSANKISDYGSQQSEKGNQDEEGDLTDISESGKENKNPDGDGTGNEEENSDLKQNNRGDKENQALKTKRLKEMNLSQEKARLLLEELKNEEVQYMQQLKKQTNNKGYYGKPEW